MAADSGSIEHRSRRRSREAARHFRRTAKNMLAQVAASSPRRTRPRRARRRRASDAPVRAPGVRAGSRRPAGCPPARQAGRRIAERAAFEGELQAGLDHLSPSGRRRRPARLRAERPPGRAERRGSGRARSQRVSTAPLRARQRSRAPMRAQAIALARRSRRRCARVGSRGMTRVRLFDHRAHIEILLTLALL